MKFKDYLVARSTSFAEMLEWTRKHDPKVYAAMLFSFEIVDSCTPEIWTDQEMDGFLLEYLENRQ